MTSCAMLDETAMSGTSMHKTPAYKVSVVDLNGRTLKVVLFKILDLDEDSPAKSSVIGSFKTEEEMQIYADLHGYDVLE